MELGWEGGPTNARFFTAFFLSLVFFFSISSDANFFFFFACGCRCHHLIFKNKSHLVLFFCRHRHQGRGRGRHKHATGRPCARGRLGSKHQLCPVKPGAALKQGGRSPSSGHLPHPKDPSLCYLEKVLVGSHQVSVLSERDLPREAVSTFTGYLGSPYRDC